MSGWWVSAVVTLLTVLMAWLGAFYARKGRQADAEIRAQSWGARWERQTQRVAAFDSTPGPPALSPRAALEAEVFAPVSEWVRAAEEQAEHEAPR